MNDNEKAAVVEKQIERLHAEVLERLKTSSAFLRWLVLGVGGIIAIGKDNQIDLLMMISPALGLLALAYWVNEHGSLIAVSRRIAAEEAKLNTIAKDSLLTYESDQESKRASMLYYRLVVHPFTAVIVAGVYFTAVAILLDAPYARRNPGRIDLLVGYWALAALAFVVAAANWMRIKADLGRSRIRQGAADQGEQNGCRRNRCS